MDLGELQVFLTVAREGSFSRAAERLYRTQPAVSLAIRKLEESLGQPLFVRGARPVRLTDAGGYEFSHVRRGDTTDVMLDYVGYDLAALRRAYRAKIEMAGLKGKMATRVANALESGLTGYTYLAESDA